MLFTSTVAHAESSGAKSPQPGFMDMMPMFVMLIFIMYFLVIRPQSKKMKAHQSFVTALKKGDSVLTTGGILGTIAGLTDQYITLEVNDGFKLRVLRTHIASSSKEEQK